MNKPQIKSIIFDLGGVIMHGGYLKFIHTYCLKCLTPKGAQTIKDLEHQVNLGKISERSFYQQINKVFGVELSPKQMRGQITKHMTPDKALLALIPNLKPAKIALFTNSIGFMARDVLHKRHIPVKKLFNRMFFSNTMHVAKPDKTGFETVITALKVKPAQALMVDDRPENIAAAKKLGMHGIVYKNAAQLAKALKQYELV